MTFIDQNIKFALVPLLILASCVLLIAQQANAEDHQFYGRHSLQFSINSSFQLGSFQGALLSYKYDISDRYSMRLGFSLEGRELETNDGYRPAWDPYTLYEYNSTEWRERWSINLTFLRHHRTGKYSVFYGAGAYYQYYDEQSIYSSIRDWNDDYQLRKSVRYTSARAPGVTFILGCSWSILDWLNIHAEYCSIVKHDFYTEERYNEDYPEENLDRTREERQAWVFYSQGVRFGLSVYF